MILHWPQITYLVITLLGAGIVIEKHGKPKKPGIESMWSALIASALINVLLYYGGFWTGVVH